MGWSHQNRPCEGESSAGALRFSEESASTESSASHHPFSSIKPHTLCRLKEASHERGSGSLERLRLRPPRLPGRWMDANRKGKRTSWMSPLPVSGNPTPESRSCDASFNRQRVCGLMEYKILKDASVEGLSVKMNKLIMLAEDFDESDLQGWRPMGGIAVVGNDYEGIPRDYVQAMVKDD